LIDVVGGSACVFGYSSGAVLALKTAVKGNAISKLVLYEAPVQGLDNHLEHQLSELLAAGRRGDAVEFFQSRIVGLPEPVVTQLRNAPFRPYLEALAHTTVYDTKIVCKPPLQEELVGVSASVLVITGEGSSDSFKQSNKLMADDLPDGQYLCLEGQNHHLAAPVLAPVVKQFLLQ
jgi:hypothetical protein